MQNKPSISVIIPNYNRADYLRAAIQSAISQSYPPLEVLVCDDGSTDHAKQVLSEFDTELVKWIDCGHNGRPAIPRNKGIAAAKAELLAFLDNDDTWQVDKLERQVMELSKGYDLVCSNAMKYTKGVPTAPMHAGFGDSTLNFYHMLSTNQVVCSSVLVKKEAVIKAGLFPESPHLRALEDYALWLRMSVLCKFRYLDACLVNYNDEVSTGIRKDSLSTAQQMRLIRNDFVTWYEKQPYVDPHLVAITNEILVLRYLTPFKKLLFRLFSV